MDHDPVVLDILDAVEDTVPALGGRLYPQPQEPQLVVALWLGAVRDDPLLAIALFGHAVAYVPVAHPSLVKLVIYQQQSPGNMDQAAEKRRGIVGIPIIQAERRPDEGDFPGFVDVKIPNLPPIIDQPVRHTPIPKPRHGVFPWVFPAHPLIDCQVSRIQKLIAPVVGAITGHIVRRCIKKPLF